MTSGLDSLVHEGWMSWGMHVFNSTTQFTPSLYSVHAHTVSYNSKLCTHSAKLILTFATQNRKRDFLGWPVAISSEVLIACNELDWPEGLQLNVHSVYINCFVLKESIVGYSPDMVNVGHEETREYQIVLTHTPDVKQGYLQDWLLFYLAVDGTTHAAYGSSRNHYRAALPAQKHGRN